MSSGDNTGERNPFAPPPADAPDQPWQPRAPQRPAGSRPEAPDAPDAPGSSGSSGSDERPQVPPPHPWSPGYQGGWHPQPAPQQPKYDPSDPTQRRARNALISGMAALVCALAGILYVALFVGALAVFWGITALRTDTRTAAGNTAAQRSAANAEPTAATLAGPTANPQTPAALGGLLTGGVAVVFVSCAIGLSLYYQDYVTCVNDALTSTAEQNCSTLAPKWYVDITSQNN